MVKIDISEWFSVEYAGSDDISKVRRYFVASTIRYGIKHQDISKMPLDEWQDYVWCAVHNAIWCNDRFTNLYMSGRPVFDSLTRDFVQYDEVAKKHLKEDSDDNAEN